MFHKSNTHKFNAHKFVTFCPLQVFPCVQYTTVMWIISDLNV